MKYPIPQPLQQEHEALHAELRNATQAGGAVGDVAQALAKLMHPHFVKEDEFALPPLGLLQPITQGPVTAEMADVLKLTDRLAAELPTMLAEHKTIVAALERLIDEAKRAERSDIVQFAHKLMLHAQTEEQVMYPAALLVGRFVRQRLAEAAPSR
ncbi:MAG TPA: hemerythrin domain-containing protein [Burkholderiaceae bacterium]|nr:hemerythrin domain-containing protein [Burkholderiaceae bacterium]